ncbi:thioredoxin family protein [Lactobacillus hamsteri]|uniref:Thioredoxin domain-containing protein n=1 Tax=Lactobacillus hamsteri DSM 5661 = JCM 6256 TaxID=1423754 RepID=A0A0R1YDZ6_9LACO|nr:thioredoxin family protein [Lactobacillus hamsteri]KRM40554.1 hypothetical protein FC39_GL000578 [Lactobacillus hamsteri DSM 5661 = JCM 6256]
MKVIKKEEKTTLDNAILYFNDAGCSLCYTENQAVERLDSEFGNIIPIYKVDANENFDLAKKYQVYSAPSVVLIKNGNKVDQFSKHLDFDQMKIVFNYYFGGLKNDR